MSFETSSALAETPRATGSEQGSSEVLDDGAQPSSASLGRPVLSDPREDPAGATRKNLAFAAFWVLVVFYATLLALLATRVVSLDQVVGLIAAFSGMQTLTTMAFAFYFASAKA